MWSRQHSSSQSHLFALAGWSVIGLEHDRHFGFDHFEKLCGGTAQAAIGAVLVLLGVKWFDHVLLVLAAASISEMFRALARPVGKTF